MANLLNLSPEFSSFLRGCVTEWLAGVTFLDNMAVGESKNMPQWQLLAQKFGWHKN